MEAFAHFCGSQSLNTAIGKSVSRNLKQSSSLDAPMPGALHYHGPVSECRPSCGPLILTKTTGLMYKLFDGQNRLVI